MMITSINYVNNTDSEFNDMEPKRHSDTATMTIAQGPFPYDTHIAIANNFGLSKTIYHLMHRVTYATMIKESHHYKELQDENTALKKELATLKIRANWNR